MNADEFNARYPVGTPVFAYPGFRPEDASDARRLVTRTRTAAQVSASGDPVVWVEGEGSYICLTHVDPVSEEEFARARAEETAAAVAALGALPMPVGDQPQPLDDRGQPRTMLDRARDALNARMTKDDLRLVLENVISYAADLEAEREKLVRWHGEDGEAMAKQRAHIAELQENLRAVAAGWDVARARVAGLEQAAEQIRFLHKDSPMGPCPVCVDADALARGDDPTVPYPCPTARLAGAKDCDPPSFRANPATDRA